MSHTIVVVPCYNEAQRLDVAEFQRFVHENPTHRFLFVDDGSTDATWDVLEQLRRAEPEGVSTCRLPVNSGKAEAVRQGMRRALADGAEYAGFWDADLATPLDTVLTFSALLDSRPDVAMVFGARVSLLGRCVERKAVRHYLGRLFATAASLTLGVGIYDTQCGAKLFRASPEIAALFEQPFQSRWIFDVEILARLIAARRGTNLMPVERIIYEYPLHAWRDVAGSKVKPSDFLKALAGLAAIRRNYRIRKPWPRRLPAIGTTHNRPEVGVHARTAKGGVHQR